MGCAGRRWGWGAGKGTWGQDALGAASAGCCRGARLAGAEQQPCLCGRSGRLDTGMRRLLGRPGREGEGGLGRAEPLGSVLRDGLSLQDTGIRFRGGGGGSQATGEKAQEGPDCWSRGSLSSDARGKGWQGRPNAASFCAAPHSPRSLQIPQRDRAPAWPPQQDAGPPVRHGSSYQPPARAQETRPRLPPPRPQENVLGVPPCTAVGELGDAERPGAPTQGSSLALPLCLHHQGEITVLPLLAVFLPPPSGHSWAPDRVCAGARD